MSKLAAIHSNDERMAANCIFRLKPDCRDCPTKLPFVSTRQKTLPSRHFPCRY